MRRIIQRENRNRNKKDPGRGPFFIINAFWLYLHKRFPALSAKAMKRFLSDTMPNSSMASIFASPPALDSSSIVPPFQSGGGLPVANEYLILSDTKYVLMTRFSLFCEYLVPVDLSLMSYP